MADILIVGKRPGSEEGKEYFLHSTDWWLEILEVITSLFGSVAPIGDWFVRELMLAPLSPHMNAEESRRLSALLKTALEDGSAEASLEKYYRESPLMVDYFEGDEELLESNKEHRIDQIREFAKFLEACGGCEAKWHGADIE